MKLSGLMLERTSQIHLLAWKWVSLGVHVTRLPFQMIKITQIIVRATLFYEIINKTFYPLIEQIIKLMSVLANVNYSLLIFGAQ